MSIALSENIKSTPMAPYEGLMRDMSLQDKQVVVAFLMDTMKGKDDREVFNRYLEEWQDNTRFLSSVKAIISHPSFLQIVNMGGNAVPFIIEEISKLPSNLVWALNSIFHKKIGSGQTITEACRLWTAELKK